MRKDIMKLRLLLLVINLHFSGFYFMVLSDIGVLAYIIVVRVLFLYWSKFLLP